MTSAGGNGHDPQFDPRGLLAALSREYTQFIVIGAFARIVQGTNELTDNLDVCPYLRISNVQRLATALEGLEAKRADRRRLMIDPDALRAEPVIRLRTSLGKLSLVAEPAGTRKGFEDLRKGASHEHLGRGVRPQVASPADLARMAAALGRPRDLEVLPELRRVMEVRMTMERTLRPDMGMGR